MADKKLVCGIMAHVDSGKTTLSEALLYLSGAIRNAGRVDKKNAFLDTYALEKERGITIFSKQARFCHEQTEVTILDTPGHVDFSAEMERTLQVLDYAILVVSGSDGMRGRALGHTQVLWKLLARYHVPTFLFVNKMDQAGTDKEELLTVLKEKLDSTIVDYTDSKEAIWDNSAMCEEQAMEEFLESGCLLEETLQRLIAERKVFPCFFGSALKMEGVTILLDALSEYTMARKYKKEFAARVYKIARDEQGNRLTYLKVTGGTLSVKAEITNRNGETQKINQIRLYSGVKYETLQTALAGEICAVTGLTGTAAGDGLGAEGKSEIPMLLPILNYRIELPRDVMPAQMLPKLRMLEEELPELHLVWNETLQEIHVELMGEVQTEILQNMVQERFGVHIAFGPGKIVYKETIAAPVEGVGHFEPLRHYAEVHLLLEPGERGSGLVFQTDVSEDELSKNWQRLVLTHLEEKEHVGVLTGSAITDMRITLVSGRAHIKHTEGGDFRQATYRAVRQGLMMAENILLEPWFDFKMEIPAAQVGRALLDLEKMQAKFTSPVPNEEIMEINGSVAVAAFSDYPKELSAYTKGEGKVECALKGYEPCRNTGKVLEELMYDPEQDLRNTPDSVFCSHGAGVIVPWNEVYGAMHLPLLKEKRNHTVENEWEEYEAFAVSAARKANEQGEIAIGTEEIDSILHRSVSANKRQKEEPGRNGWAKKTVYHDAAPSVYQGKKDALLPELLIVDGYNVIFAWEELKHLAEDNLDAARDRLIEILGDYRGMRHCELMVVFDAYRVQGRRSDEKEYATLRVVYTSQDQTADRFIERYAHENRGKYRITVVTSDGLEQVTIRAQGCLLMSSRELFADLQSRKMVLQKEYLSKEEKLGNYLPIAQAMEKKV